MKHGPSYIRMYIHIYVHTYIRTHVHSNTVQHALCSRCVCSVDLFGCRLADTYVYYAHGIIFYDCLVSERWTIYPACTRTEVYFVVLALVLHTKLLLHTDLFWYLLTYLSSHHCWCVSLSAAHLVQVGSTATGVQLSFSAELVEQTAARDQWWEYTPDYKHYTMSTMRLWAPYMYTWCTLEHQ